MSIGENLCDSLVLKVDKSSVNVAYFNDPSVCVCTGIFNRLRSVTSMAHNAAFGSDMGAAILG